MLDAEIGARNTDGVIAPFVDLHERRRRHVAIDAAWRFGSDTAFVMRVSGHVEAAGVSVVKSPADMGATIKTRLAR